MTSELLISVTDARSQLADLVNRVAYTGEQVTLTRHGRPMAVLVSVADAGRARSNSEEASGTVSSLPAQRGHTPKEPDRRYGIAAQSHAPTPRSGGGPGSSGGTC